MTPMNNADYLTRLEHADELESLKAAKRASGLTYEQLAELIGVNKVWLASVFEGQQYVPEEYTLKLAEALKISPSATAFLNSHPYKGNTDPILTDFMKLLILTVLPSKTLFTNRVETPS